MNTAITAYSKSRGYVPDTNTFAKNKHKEECEQRIARRMNGADPEFVNGKTLTRDAKIKIGKK